MGGMKDSGLGRRHGSEGILKYTEAQTVAQQRLLPLAPSLGHGRREVRGVHEPQPEGDEGPPPALAGPRRAYPPRPHEESHAQTPCPESRTHVPDDAYDYDVIVVGSGFGGSVSALRLTEKGYRVGVLEAGRRFTRETLPKNSWDLQELPVGARRSASTASSASTCSATSWCWRARAWAAARSTTPTPSTCRPTPFFEDPQWSDITDWQEELEPYYDQARRMLGVRLNPTMTPSDVHLKAAAERMGVGDTFHMAPVGVFFGDGEDADGTAKAAARRRGRRPLLRRRGPRPQGLHRVRRVHDRLPPRREEHPQRELPPPRREGRRRHPPDDHGRRRHRGLAGRLRASRTLPTDAERKGRGRTFTRPPGRRRGRHVRHPDPAAPDEGRAASCRASPSGSAS